MRIIFVFGSNLAGRHGKGAALAAVKHYGAMPGVGSGPTGSAYAIPTKDAWLRSLEWSAVEKHLDTFLEYAKKHSDDLFLLTPVGCGLAGNDIRRLALHLRKRGLTTNVVLTASWLNDYNHTI